ncbi:MAG: hypothetical protein M1817_003575 [Caeruleum heppii]|nr:MAG: hypothetical protein M1817_003575 [Caeruleum heppii]
MARSTTSSSFATFLILCPTSFFLGMLFSSFPYDYPLLWTRTAPTAEYYTQLETHLRHIHSSPAIIPRLLHIIIFLGLAGFVTKLYKPSEANMLFDGASLALYVVAVIIYITNIVEGLRVVSAGSYGQGAAAEEAVKSAGDAMMEVEIVGREESLKVMSASNTILALVLVGVLVLQAGQWYAERKEKEELERMEREDRVSHEGPRKSAGAHKAGNGGGTKKKQ